MTSTDPSTANDQIRALLSTYETSLNTSDAGLAAACYSPDGVFMPTTLPTASGADLQSAYEQIFAAIRLEVSFNIDELVIATDDIADALTRSQGTQTVLATGTESPESNREIFLFAMVSGDWKISRYMFNKSA
ncbi:MAG: nuclear transport factor 2 family protein [Candidatus Nanopelagicales bacterium]